VDQGEVKERNQVPTGASRTTTKPPRVKPSWEYTQQPIADPLAPSNKKRVPKKPTRFGEDNIEASLYFGRQPNRYAYLASEMAEEPINKDPQSVSEVMAGRDRQKWIDSMNVELDNIESKGTWIETVLPAGRRAVGCRWVFKVKEDADGKIIKYKSRLVAQGFSQQPGVDYEETFAPVGRATSLRILLSILANKDYYVKQLDVEGAYLNGELDVEIYMKYPPGFTPKKGCNVLKLVKSLYGLKQSGRTWWMEMGKGLGTIGFERLESDWGLYRRPETKDRCEILILGYVDDLVVSGKSEKEVDKVMKEIGKIWTITGLGDINTILGLKVERNRAQRTIWITQPAYIDKLLEKFPKYQSHRTRITPMATEQRPNSKLDTIDGPTPLTRYQAIIGSLQWLATCTRPNIAFATSFLARSVSDPKESHWRMAVAVVAYLANTRTMGIEIEGIQ